MSCLDFYGLSGKRTFEGIPLGRKDATNMKDWFDHLKIAKQELTQALSPGQWDAPAEEGLMGTMIENPTALRGETIVGISHQMTKTGGSTIVFGGKVVEVADVKKSGGRPHYHATLETPTGRQEVHISGAHAIHILKTKSELKIMGIATVDSLPLGKTKSYSVRDWVESFHKAKAKLANVLNLSEWQPAGRETSLGTDIDLPSALKGKIICGVDMADGQDGATVTILAGKVLDVYNISQANEPPFYRGKIDGPLGNMEIDISGLHSVHILK